MSNAPLTTYSDVVKIIHNPKRHCSSSQTPKFWRGHRSNIFNKTLCILWMTFTVWPYVHLYSIMRILTASFCPVSYNIMTDQYHQCLCMANRCFWQPFTCTGKPALLSLLHDLQCSMIGQLSSKYKLLTKTFEGFISFQISSFNILFTCIGNQCCYWFNLSSIITDKDMFHFISI